MILFSVIYEFDTLDFVGYSQPPKHRTLWELTESGPSEYDYLGGGWEKAKHRKYVALLTREQFEEFQSDCGLYAEDCETMGSLGAPGFGFGWAPAIPFRMEEHSTIGSAYVTPMVAKKGEDGEWAPVKPNADERDWKRLRKVVIARYS